MENKIVENMINEFSKGSEIVKESSWVEILASNISEDVCRCITSNIIELIERLEDILQKNIEEEIVRNLKFLSRK